MYNHYEEYEMNKQKKEIKILLEKCSMVDDNTLNRREKVYKRLFKKLLKKKHDECDKTLKETIGLVKDDDPLRF